MIKDVCAAAAHMLGLTEEAEELLLADCSEETAARWLRLYDLVVREIAEEYRRGESTPPGSPSLGGETAAFTGITPRMIAYGVAAEYAITEGLDVAEMWDSRFRSSLSLAARPALRIRARRMM